MNKSMILLALVALNSLGITAEPNNVSETIIDQITAGVSQMPSYITKAGGYLLSSNGAKDLALAYCLGMGLTAIHELGHAIASKILYGTPIQLVLGATPRSNHPSYVQIGGITLGGFDPATGYATFRLNNALPLKNAAIYAAGPIFGALSSLGAYVLLSKYDGLYIAKAASLFGLFNHTFGKAGIGGISTPGTDAYRVVDSLRQYREG
jgi:hypothetical protein